MVDPSEDRKVDRSEDRKVDRSEGRSEDRKVDRSEDQRVGRSEGHWGRPLLALMVVGAAWTPLQEAGSVRTQPLARGWMRASKESATGRKMEMWALLPELTEP